MQKGFSRLRSLAAVGMMMTAAGFQSPAQEPFANWPAGASPKEIGQRVAENFAARKFDYQTNRKRKYVIYPEACAWYGSLTLAKLISDRGLQNRLIRKFDPLLTAEGARRISPDAHVDYRVFGIVPLEIYLQTKEEKYLDLGQGLADRQWTDATPDGNVRNVCAGTNKGDSTEYYLKRPRNVGDLHGQAPILWCASALLR
jgi:hypothetical protein